MNPLDFLGVANRLQRSAAEAERRTSISRSYYATYHVLFDSLSAKEVHFERGADDHGRLVYYLAHNGDQQTRKIGSYLRDLRTARREADYDLTKSVDAYKSRMMYKIASGAIRRFNALPPDDFEQIVNVIKTLPPYSPPLRNP